MIVLKAAQNNLAGLTRHRTAIECGSAHGECVICVHATTTWSCETLMKHNHIHCFQGRVPPSGNAVSTTQNTCCWSIPQKFIKNICLTSGMQAGSIDSQKKATF